MVELLLLLEDYSFSQLQDDFIVLKGIIRTQEERDDQDQDDDGKEEDDYMVDSNSNSKAKSASALRAYFAEFCFGGACDGSSCGSLRRTHRRREEDHESRRRRRAFLMRADQLHKYGGAFELQEVLLQSTLDLVHNHTMHSADDAATLSLLDLDPHHALKFVTQI